MGPRRNLWVKNRGKTKKQKSGERCGSWRCDGKSKALGCFSHRSLEKYKTLFHSSPSAGSD
jgi:hypothetical protein